MNLLLTIHDSDIYPEKIKVNPDDFNVRYAARAVVVNDRNEIALLKAATYSYHKLPGGGVEPGEDMKIALERELSEEIGCSADIIAEVGEIIEYRNRWKLKQISHCYLARQVGEQQPPQFTETEINEGFEMVWVDTIETAITLLEQDEPENYDGMFIQRRDSQLLKAAAQILAS